MKRIGIALGIGGAWVLLLTCLQYRAWSAHAAFHLLFPGILVACYCPISGTLAAVAMEVVNVAIYSGVAYGLLAMFRIPLNPAG